MKDVKEQVTTTTVTTTTKYTPKLKGPAREFDYVEDVKVSGEADPWMRSRNVYFNANGLRPFTKHYHYLDSQQVDVVPKLCEIEMQSGTFTVFEDADIFTPNGTKNWNSLGFRDLITSLVIHQDQILVLV